MLAHFNWSGQSKTQYTLFHTLQSHLCFWCLTAGKFLQSTSVWYCYLFICSAIQFCVCPILFLSEEILERLRVKKEEELEEVKRRAAEEAQKARLEREKEEVDVEKDDENAKLTDEDRQDAKVRDWIKEEERETKEEVKEEKSDAIKSGGSYEFSSFRCGKTSKNEAQSDDESKIKQCNV